MSDETIYALCAAWAEFHKMTYDDAAVYLPEYAAIRDCLYREKRRKVDYNPLDRHFHVIAQLRLVIIQKKFQRIDPLSDVEQVMLRLDSDRDEKYSTLAGWLKEKKKQKATKRHVIFLFPGYRPLIIDGCKIAKYKDKTPTIISQPKIRRYKVVEVWEKK